MALTAIDIINEVAEKYGITQAELRAPGRRQYAVRRKDKRPDDTVPLYTIRSEVARRLRTERNLSLRQIGYLLGSRDHSTIARMINDRYRERHLAGTARRAAKNREAVACQ